MALRFISHKEVSFRQLLGMLRTPPIAMMNYYSNLFMSARFVFGEMPDRIRRLDKEARRIECMVGVEITPDSDAIQALLAQLDSLRKEYEADINRLENMWESADEAEQKQIEAFYRGLVEKMSEIDRKEYFLLFRLNPLMDLKMIEAYMDNNMDLKSFFKEHGRVVTQMQLSAELDKVKRWVYQEAVQLMPYIRFTKLE